MIKPNGNLCQNQKNKSVKSKIYIFKPIRKVCRKKNNRIKTKEDFLQYNQTANFLNNEQKNSSNF